MSEYKMTKCMACQKFISAAALNQTLNGIVKIQKKTKSLVFITCEILDSDKNIVVVASGVWKIL